MHPNLHTKAPSCQWFSMIKLLPIARSPASCRSLSLPQCLQAPIAAQPLIVSHSTPSPPGSPQGPQSPQLPKAPPNLPLCHSAFNSAPQGTAHSALHSTHNLQVSIALQTPIVSHSTPRSPGSPLAPQRSHSATQPSTVFPKKQRLQPSIVPQISKFLQHPQPPRVSHSTSKPPGSL